MAGRLYVKSELVESGIDVQFGNNFSGLTLEESLSLCVGGIAAIMKIWDGHAEEMLEKFQPVVGAPASPRETRMICNGMILLQAAIREYATGDRLCEETNALFERLKSSLDGK